MIPLEDDPPSVAEDNSRGMDETDLRRLKFFMEELYAEFQNAFMGNPNIMEVIQRIRSAGYDIDISVNTLVERTKREPGPADTHEPTPLVRDGEVTSETFTKTDQDFMQEFHIRL
jgi:hypothetical protein